MHIAPRTGHTRLIPHYFFVLYLFLFNGLMVWSHNTQYTCSMLNVAHRAARIQAM